MQEDKPVTVRRRLQVFLITPMFPPGPGGGGMHVFYLAKALGEKKGIRVHLFAPGEPLPGGDKRWLRSKRIFVHRTDFSSEPTSVPYSEVITNLDPTINFLY